MGRHLAHGDSRWLACARSGLRGQKGIGVAPADVMSVAITVGPAGRDPGQVARRTSQPLAELGNEDLVLAAWRRGLDGRSAGGRRGRRRRALRRVVRGETPACAHQVQVPDRWGAEPEPIKACWDEHVVPRAERATDT